jgi:hypothetical protein
MIGRHFKMLKIVKGHQSEIHTIANLWFVILWRNNIGRANVLFLVTTTRRDQGVLWWWLIDKHKQRSSTNNQKAAEVTNDK